jgi:type I restriction enzyme, S subunit
LTVAAPWVPRRLGELVSLTSGQSPSGFRFGTTGIPYYKVDQLGRSQKYLTRNSTPYFSPDLPRVPAGSVLIAKRGGAIALNRIRLISESSFMDTNVMALTPGTEIDSEFLFYWLGHRGLWDVTDVTSVPQINNKHINPLEIALPGLAEQREIAAALRGVDDLLGALERMMGKKRAIKQGMMQQLLTGETRLPGFSSQWREVLLGDHVSYIRTVQLSRAQLDEESPVRYLHYGDIHTRTSVRLDAAHESMPRVSSGYLRNAGRLRVGDVVFADASEDSDGVGKSVEVTSVPEAGVVPGLHTIAARFDQTVLADGFKAYIQFVPLFRQALLRLAAGTKVLATTRSFISSITLSLPDAEEQRAIAAVLSDADAEVQRLQDRLVKTRDIKQGMIQELLTGRARLPEREAAV